MLLRSVAWLTVAVASLATLACALVVAGGNYCWSAFAFTMTAGSVSAGILLMAMLPSWLRYRKTRQPSDRTTLRLAGYSFLILAMEAVVLQLIPQRGE